MVGLFLFTLTPRQNQMAKWSVFNIGSANKQIDELKAENETLKQQVKAFEEATPEAVTQLQGEVAAIKTEAADAKAKLLQAESDLATAKQTIGTLTAEKAQLAKDLDAKGKEVEAAASKKAAEIQASIGAPAAPAIPPTAKPATEATGFNRIVAATAAQISATKTK